ncbi:MAG: TIGR03084 family metal-binding protein [Acidimicrobiales bacterium]
MTASTAMTGICDDLAAEHAALDAIVAPLDEAGWSKPTPAAGWAVRHQIIHLVLADIIGRIAVEDPAAFHEFKAKGRTLEEAFGSGKGKSGAELLEWWRDERERMLAAFRPLDAKARIPWFGPDMSALSFATARLMETWAHGQDVVDALGVARPATDRLRHVAHIGVTTRGWSYANRGLPSPEGAVRVELTSPGGERWTWGPEEADAVVRGPAEDFCLVVTQRRHPADTALVCEGDLAADWMGRAQAFAGPATNNRPPRS